MLYARKRARGPLEAGPLHVGATQGRKFRKLRSRKIKMVGGQPLAGRKPSERRYHKTTAIAAAAYMLQVIAPWSWFGLYSGFSYETTAIPSGDSRPSSII
jgi:hypothetical protein